jgi:hypothetical protein
MRQDIRIHLDLSVPARTLVFLLAAVLLVTVTPELGSENVTLSTYYPAPSGVYNQMITTNNTYLATSGGSVGIGTTSPVTTDAEGLSVKLDVGGGIAIANNTSLGFKYNNGQGTGASYPVIQVDAGNNLHMGDVGNAFNGIQFHSGGAAQMQLSPQGNLQIGQGSMPASAGQAGYLYINNTATNCQGPFTNNTPGGSVCSQGQYATWTQGLYIEGFSYNNLGYPAQVNVGGAATTNQVWALLPSGNWGPGALEVQPDGGGAVWCCPK